MLELIKAALNSDTNQLFFVMMLVVIYGAFKTFISLGCKAMDVFASNKKSEPKNIHDSSITNTAMCVLHDNKITNIDAAISEIKATIGLIARNTNEILKILCVSDNDDRKKIYVPSALMEKVRQILRNTEDSETVLKQLESAIRNINGS